MTPQQRNNLEDAKRIIAQAIQAAARRTSVLKQVEQTSYEATLWDDHRWKLAVALTALHDIDNQEPTSIG